MGPRNEDRQRFLTALGLGFCQQGNHTVQYAYDYDGRSWCYEHPCPSGPSSERKEEGTCSWGRMHRSPAVIWVPALGRHLCHRHFVQMFTELMRRGTWGEK
jgi:hypothetical protein